LKKIYKTHAKLTDKSGRILKKMFGASDEMRKYAIKRGSAKLQAISKRSEMHTPKQRHCSRNTGSNLTRSPRNWTPW
jgi:hypothetical protein